MELVRIHEPHREVYGFAQDFQFNLVIAACTVLSWMFSREAKKIPLTPITVLMIIFMLLMILSTYTGEIIDYSSIYLYRTTVPDSFHKTQPICGLRGILEVSRAAMRWPDSGSLDLTMAFLKTFRP
ncbi:MAG: DUF5935 domain-containing protein, partial [Alphaproteobacteria bacterium]